MPVWKQTTLDDRKRIVDYIVADNPMAGIALGDALIEKAGQLDAPALLLLLCRSRSLTRMVA